LTYKTGFGLDYRIYRALYIHTTWNYRQYSYISIVDIHTLQITITRALGFSVFTSRTLTTDLSQSHCHFKTHIKSSSQSLVHFLPIFCNCKFRRFCVVQFIISRQVGVPKLGSSLHWTTLLLSTTLSTSSHLLAMFFNNRSAGATQKTQPMFLTERAYRIVA
jgi:hypothetical protein